MKKLHATLVGLALAGTVVLAWWVQNRSQATAADVAATAAAPSRGPGSGPTVGAGGSGGPVAVEVGRATTSRLDDDAQAVGSLRARRSVVLRPEVSGRIVRLDFTDGQRVRRGQVLVQLDDTLPRAQLKQAEAQAAIARTNLERSRDLAAQNFMSQSVVDQNAASLDVANAQVALAQAQVTRMRVLAPFDAVAGIRSVSLGDYVKDGADIVTLEDIGAMWVDVRLPEREAARVRIGLGVEAMLDALPAQRFRGRVEALDAQVDANGRSLLVRASIDNPSGVLRSGMFARARIVFASRDNALLVPEEALVPLGGKQVLYKVVEGDGGARVARRVDARLGQRVPGRVEILEGLKPGDLVVTAGHARLARGDGLPVRIVDIDKPAAPGGPASAASGTPGAPPMGPSGARTGAPA